jgi:hypothetical protein
MKKDKYIQPKIKHILRDGTVLDSMEGFILPVTNETMAYYQIRADQLKRQLQGKPA